MPAAGARNIARMIITLSVAGAAAVVAAASGCSAYASTFEIVDYRQAGSAERYRETFDEGYFDIDEHGNVDIVLRRAAPTSDRASQTITQIVHIKSVWRSIPGTTVAHRTQLNGTISYHILSGQTGASFEGAGSIFFDLGMGKDSLSGTLGLAVLHPKRRLAADPLLFRQAELKWHFRASRDPRRVVRIVNEMNRLFRQPPNRP
jgi:hypothetical protein